MQHKRWFSPSIFIKYYSQTDKTPNLFDVFVPVAISLFRLKVQTALQLIRFARILKIRESNSADVVYSLPVELLVVCGPQDISILPLCIKSVFQFSVNPISKVVIVVPESDAKKIKKLLLEIDKTGEIPIVIVNENEFIPIEIRSKLKHNFEERFGWILQQVIKVNYTAQSQAKAVLVMDADTVLLQPLRGVDINGKQHLSYSSEKHRSYSEFLKCIQLPIRRPFYSTVTHHMIIQPAIMRELLMNFGMQDLDKLTEKLLKFSSMSVMSPVSIDYEMYGQYLRYRYPNKINYSHFSNQSIQRSSVAFQEVEDILKGNKISKFRSFSFHAYLK